jgi:aryl-alcohol dehydrogenase-like predicted oxidoreductase
LKKPKGSTIMKNATTLRPLGKTTMQITPIGLGMMEMSGGGGLLGKVFPVIPQEEKNAIIQAALDGGINWFDTAELYGQGVSEKSLADGLKAAGKRDEEILVTTKWNPFLRTAKTIPTSIGDRLRFLEPYSIANFMVHQPTSFSSIETEMNAMADLVEAGKIRSVGVSNFNAARMRRAHAALAKRGLPLAVNQMHYSLIHREIERNGVLETAKELGITIIAYTPLGSGLLTGRYHKDPASLEKKSWFWKMRIKRNLERTRPLIAIMEEIAENHKATVGQVALNWVINFAGETVVTIPGATKVYQAQEAAGAMNFNLSPDELARLDEASRRM